MDIETLARALVERTRLAARRQGCTCDLEFYVRKLYGPSPRVDTVHRQTCVLVLRSRARWN